VSKKSKLSGLDDLRQLGSELASSRSRTGYMIRVWNAEQTGVIQLDFGREWDTGMPDFSIQDVEAASGQANPATLVPGTVSEGLNGWSKALTVGLAV